MKSTTITNNSENVAIINRMDFEGVDDVFNALFFAFHPEGIESGENGADARFVALWTLFLSSVGWTEEQYWAEVETREDDGTYDEHEEEPIEQKLNSKSN